MERWGYVTCLNCVIAFPMAALLAIPFVDTLIYIILHYESPGGFFFFHGLRMD